MSVILHYGMLQLASGLDEVIEEETLNLSSYIPAGDDEGLWILVTVNDLGAVVLTAGTPISPIADLIVDGNPYGVPATPANTVRRSAAVKIYRDVDGNAQTEIREDPLEPYTDIVDLRMWDVMPGQLGLNIHNAAAETSLDDEDEFVFWKNSNGLIRKITKASLASILGGGESGILYSNISPTTADISAAVNTVYFADISGLTADRNFKLPTGAIGDVVELHITVGDATHELIILGDTGITINGGSAATEWSRVFISGEVIKLVASSTTNWQVTYDGRIPQKVRYSSNAAQSIANNTVSILDFEDLGYDTKPAVTIGAAWKFTAARAGYYRVDAKVVFDASTGWEALEFAALTLYRNNAEYSYLDRPQIIATQAGAYRLDLQGSDTILLAAGDYIDVRLFQVSDAAIVLLNGNAYNYVDISEL